MTRVLDSVERTARTMLPAGQDLLDRVASRPWIGPAVVMVVAVLTRLVGLGHPHVLVFDETYYVKDAWSLWHLGYEGSWFDQDAPPGYSTVNAAFEAGHVDFYSRSASFASHPPLGKWIIGLGEVLAGGAQNAAGWRLSVAVVGILAVALLMVVAHRMFRTPLVTTVAGGLFAIDGQAILMSRVALLDNMVMLFALAGFACVLEDRFRTERQLGTWLMSRRRGIGQVGPVLWRRPWLVGAGAAFGLCSAVKWSGLYFLVAFVLYVIGTDLLLRRRAGVPRWAPAGLVMQGPVTAALAVAPALLAYLLSWTGWFVTTGGYHREWVQSPAGAADRFTGILAGVPAALQDLWTWHTSIYQFHVGLDVPHNYASPAILWPILNRPTAMWFDFSKGAGPQDPVQIITDLPNPLIWYAAWAAAVYLAVRFVRYREWQAALILVGIAAGWTPWLLYPHRTMFLFYSIAFEPFLLLALAATLGLMVVPPPGLDSPDTIRADQARYGLRARRGLVTGFLVLAVLVSVYFLPLVTGMTIPDWYWRAHLWSVTWL